MAEIDLAAPPRLSDGAAPPRLASPAGVIALPIPPASCHSAAVDAKAADALLQWYDRQAIQLPWRAFRGSAPPPAYRVWLAEIMLQQTTVAAAVPYYLRFLERWPTVDALADAEDAEVMTAWAGLGYYARARNLLRCARAVAHDHAGEFPRSESGLRALPGVGAYTAAAIAAIAWGERALVVDGNVERVASRLLALPRPPAAERAAILKLLDLLTPQDRPGDFAQAFMDLGRTICRPRAPDCLQCPLRPHCAAATRRTPEAFPVKAPRRTPPERTGDCFLLTNAGAVLLEVRPATGLLGGMRGFPQAPPTATLWRELGSVRHVFSHFALTLTVRTAAAPTYVDGLWWPLDRLDEAGLPTLFRRAAALWARELAGVPAAA